MDDALVETQENQIEARQPEAQPLRVWAEKAGHLPATFEGDKLRPVRFNRKAWLPQAVCARLRLTFDSPITESTYLEAAAAVASADAR